MLTDDFSRDFFQSSSQNFFNSSSKGYFGIVPRVSGSIPFGHLSNFFFQSSSLGSSRDYSYWFSSRNYSQKLFRDVLVLFGISSEVPFGVSPTVLPRVPRQITPEFFRYFSGNFLPGIPNVPRKTRDIVTKTPGITIEDISKGTSRGNRDNK